MEEAKGMEDTARTKIILESSATQLEVWFPEQGLSYLELLLYFLLELATLDGKDKSSPRDTLEVHPK